MTTSIPEGTIDWEFCAVSLAEAKHAAYMASEIVRHLKKGIGSEREAMEWLETLHFKVEAALKAANHAIRATK